MPLSRRPGEARDDWDSTRSWYEPKPLNRKGHQRKPAKPGKEKPAFIPATPFRTSNLRVPLVSFVVAVDFRTTAMRLERQVALITGGTSGIGEATALLFAREGAQVAITGRNEKRGHAVTAAILEGGGKAIFLRTDVRRAAECERAVRETVQTFGRLDILFNNAGIFYPHDTLECSEEEWDEQIDINLKGAFLMSKAALPGMIAQGRGVIIHNSSGWGIVGGDKAVAYCASKGGLVLMTKAMAVDHGRQGIRVNCICPGDVETPMLPQDAKMRGQKWEDYLAGCANRPLGRIGTAEEIAKAVLFLASEDSSFMTGAALVVDGGGTAN
jgi:NAD(P)-dependent dehydrogenase (short-subunit alcohol dehydrogenase family)